MGRGENFQNTEAFTEISAGQWDFITSENLTAKEAVEFLKNGMRVRTFRDNISDIYGTDDCEKLLAEGLCKSAEMYEGKVIQPDSMRKKIRNWMAGKNFPTDREEVFQICFTLDLGLEQSERMLTRLTEQGIHYRNSREIIYAYCLKYHLGYENALRMCEQMSKEKSGGKESGEPMTQVMKLGFQKISAEEDLFSFILNNKMRMGNSHNTAYAYFTKMLSLLSGEELEGEEKYSMEDIADTYLRLNVPLDKKTSGYSNVQKIVKKYWPGARAVKSMKSRSEEVNRKTLLLLYIVTGGEASDKYEEADEAYISSEEFLEFHCKKMNHMLRDCGMSRIDPRNVFDYLVLYCLRPEEDLFMSDRMALLMSEVFEETIL